MKRIKQSIKAVIFDMDGTIIKSERLWHEANLEVLKAHGITNITDEQNKSISTLSGTGLSAAVQLMKNKFGITDSVESLMNETREHFIKLLSINPPQFIEGFEKFHDKLASENILSCIATNADELTINHLIRQFNFPKFFGSNIFDISKVNHKLKPDPAIFLHAMEQLKVTASECVIFEDSLVGFTAAQKANVRCIAVKNESNKEHLHHAHEHIDHYDHALDALLRLIEKHKK